MDNAQKHIDLIGIIQNNERKSRNRLTIWIAVCLTLSFLTLYFGFESQQKTNQLKYQNEIIQKQSNALNLSRKDLLTAQDSLRLLLSKVESKIKDPVIKAAINKEVSGTVISGSIVYIQEFGENGRQYSKEIQAVLKQNGFIVPGIEKMKKEFMKSRITYFHDEDLEIATSVYNITKEVVLRFDPNFNVEQLNPKKFNEKAPLKQIEVWIRY